MQSPVTMAETPKVRSSVGRWMASSGGSGLSPVGVLLQVDRGEQEAPGIARHRRGDDAPILRVGPFLVDLEQLDLALGAVDGLLGAGKERAEAGFLAVEPAHRIADGGLLAAAQIGHQRLPHLRRGLAPVPIRNGDMQAGKGIRHRRIGDRLHEHAGQRPEKEQQQEQRQRRNERGRAKGFLAGGGHSGTTQASVGAKDAVTSMPGTR